VGTVAGQLSSRPKTDDTLSVLFYTIRYWVMLVENLIPFVVSLELRRCFIFAFSAYHFLAVSSPVAYASPGAMLSGAELTKQVSVTAPA